MRSEALASSSMPRIHSRSGGNNTIIESLGVYLPQRTVDTEDILKGCRKPVRFPLQQTTGIRTRHVAGDGEYAIDLAAEAVSRCLSLSHRDPASIDLLICCNISRWDGPDQFQCEPGTAVRLGRRFGLTSARAMDISNACAGLFTGIAVADAYLRTGASRLALVVSGELITHLTTTAQREISGFMDERLACLTLGDAGAALLLEEGPDRVAGFHEIELYTLGEYSRACIARASDKPAGGAIMLTDVVKLSSAAVTEATQHAVAVQQRAGWPPELLDHLIMHQTSERTIQEAATHVDRIYGRPVSADWNVVSSVGRRGNTATTSHFVAFHDDVLAGKINNDHNVLFSVNGSGLTIGTAVYKCDDLPERLRGGAASAQDADGAAAERPAPTVRGEVPPPRVSIDLASVTLLEPHQPAGMETLDLAAIAVETCLERSRLDRAHIDLLIHAGVYRTQYLTEPALAALIAGLVGMNHQTSAARRTLCFDILNGSAGFLTACDVAAKMLARGEMRHALLVASEVDNNRPGEGPSLGLERTASAVILTHANAAGPGLSEVAFRSFPELIDCFESYCDLTKAGGRLMLKASDDYEEQALRCLADAAEDYLGATGTTPDFVLAPQISGAFLRRLEQRLGSIAPVLDNTSERGNLYTSSLPAALCKARAVAKPGAVGLMIEFAAGIQVACATYRF